MSNLLLALSTKANFIIMSIFAFAGIISLFQINSALADRKKIGKVFLAVGIICIIIAGIFLYKVVHVAGVSRFDQ